MRRVCASASPARILRASSTSFMIEGASTNGIAGRVYIHVSHIERADR